MRELYAVVYLTCQFRHLLLATPLPFIVYTDNSVLTWLLKLQEPAAILARWNQSLAELNVEYLFRLGARNNQADALSRLMQYERKHKLCENA